MDGFREFIPGEVWDLLVAAGETRDHARGDALMVQGERAASVLALTRGRVKVIHTDDQQNRHLLSVCGEGDLLGEVAFLGDGRRSATVVAIDSCRTAELSAEGFRKFCARHGLTEELSRHVVRRLADGERSRTELTLLQGRERLIRFLLRLARSSAALPCAQEGVVDLGIGQTDLIMGLGLSKATVAAELARLRSRGAVIRSRTPLTVDVAELARQAAREGRRA